MTATLFIVAFGILADRLDSADYVKLIVIYNLTILSCGVALLGYPTILQHRFSKEFVDEEKLRSSAFLIVLISILIAIIACFLVAELNNIDEKFPLFMWMIFYTLFTQLLMMCFGLGKIIAINISEILGSLILFFGVYFSSVYTLGGFFWVLAVSYILRSLVLIFQILLWNATRSRSVNNSESLQKDDDLPFWRTSFISASTIVLFRLIVPIAEASQISKEKILNLVLYWPMIDRLLTLTTNLNAIIFRFISTNRINTALLRIIHLGIAIISPIAFVAIWAIYSSVMELNFSLDMTYILVLILIAGWSFRAFQINTLVARSMTRVIFYSSFIQLVWILVLWVLAYYGYLFGVNQALIFILMSIYGFCLLSAVWSQKADKG